MRNRLKNLFTPPGPKDLGWSKNDALALRSLTPFTEEKTWEDWHTHVQKEYPIRYVLSEVVARWFSFQWARLEHMWYWLKCHLLPSYRFHKLDLRGVDPTEPKYTHGYISPPEVLWLSAWASLCLYVNEKPQDPELWFTDDDLREPGLALQKANYDEAMTLHHWWTIGRKQEHEEEDRLYQVMQGWALARNREAYKEAQTVWLDTTRRNEEKEDEMLLRLVKIRRSLWT